MHAEREGGREGARLERGEGELQWKHAEGQGTEEGLNVNFDPCRSAESDCY